MNEAMLYEARAENKVRCNLCNHQCRIREGKRGICGVKENRNGKLNSLVYGKIIAEHIDPIEKNRYSTSCPVLRHFPSEPWGAISTASIVRTLIFLNTPMRVGEKSSVRTARPNRSLKGPKRPAAKASLTPIPNSPYFTNSLTIRRFWPTAKALKTSLSVMVI